MGGWLSGGVDAPAIDGGGAGAVAPPVGLTGADGEAMTARRRDGMTAVLWVVALLLLLMGVR